MLQNKFNFNYNNQIFTIIKTNHLYEKKFGNLERYAFFNQEILIEILTVAMQNNFTSFRNKGEIVIQFKDSKNIFYSILSILNNENEIIIITIYKDMIEQNFNSFKKIKNRINLHQVFTFDNSYYKQKNFDSFIENHQGISTGITKIKNNKFKLKIIKKKKDIKNKTLTDVQISQEEILDFLKFSKNIKKII